MYLKHVMLLSLAMSFLFLFGIMAIYLCHHLASTIKSIDIPDNLRKGHKIPTPSTGGIGIFLTFLVGLIFALKQPVYAFSDELLSFAPYFLFSICLIAATGFYDDVKGLSSKPKFTLQIAASLIIVVGLDQTLLASSITYSELPIYTKLLLHSLFILWIVANCNAVNLIDGVDGLAGSIALTIIAGLCALAGYWGQYDMILILLPLAAAILPFLVFNRPPASIFMGDTGSLLIGFVLPVLALVIGLNSPHWSYNIILIAFFGVPLLDTVTSIFRRVSMGINIFESDNNHAHHVIQRKYKSPGMAILVMVALSIIFQTYGLWLATLTTVADMVIAVGTFILSAASFVVYYYLNLMNKNSYFRLKYINENRHVNGKGNDDERDKIKRELKNKNETKNVTANHLSL